MHSSSDLSDLDFVEKESGVGAAQKEAESDRKHAQNMETKEHDRLSKLDQDALNSLSK